jgi:hypothetical protein
MWWPTKEQKFPTMAIFAQQIWESEFARWRLKEISSLLESSQHFLNVKLQTNNLDVDFFE